eukprot:Lankesteria_metandrocarpae@DN8072_c0_g1_i1.p1
MSVPALLQGRGDSLVFLLQWASAGSLTQVWDINARDALGRTALHFASRQGDEYLCSILLANGANASAVETVSGLSVLHYAVMSGSTNTLLSLLFSSNLDIAATESGNRQWTPFHEAIARLDFRAVCLLARRGAAHLPTEESQPVLTVSHRGSSIYNSQMAYGKKQKFVPSTVHDTTSTSRGRWRGLFGKVNMLSGLAGSCVDDAIVGLEHEQKKHQMEELLLFNTAALAAVSSKLEASIISKVDYPLSIANTQYSGLDSVTDDRGIGLETFTGAFGDNKFQQFHSTTGNVVYTGGRRMNGSPGALSSPISRIAASSSNRIKTRLRTSATTDFIPPDPSPRTSTTTYTNTTTATTVFSTFTSAATAAAVSMFSSAVKQNSCKPVQLPRRQTFIISPRHTGTTMTSSRRDTVTDHDHRNEVVPSGTTAVQSQLYNEGMDYTTTGSVGSSVSGRGLVFCTPAKIMKDCHDCGAVFTTELLSQDCRLCGLRFCIQCASICVIPSSVLFLDEIADNVASHQVTKTAASIRYDSSAAAFQVPQRNDSFEVKPFRSLALSAKRRDLLNTHRPINTKQQHSQRYATPSPVYV